MTDDQSLHISDTPLGTGFELISQFSAATESQRMLTGLWSAHTWTYRAFAATPRIFFQAEGPGCGKTVHLEVSTALSANPLVVGYSSQASVYNWLEEHPDTTVGLDESDKIFGTNGRRTTRDILRSVINAGYSSNGKVMVTRGGRAVQIPIYCPMGMAGLGTLPTDTQDRSLVIALEKAQPDITWVPELYQEDLEFVGAQVGEWLQTKDNQAILRAAPTLADVSGSPRFRLIMAPMAAIAQLAGCLDQFKTAVTEIQTGIAEKPPTPKYVLLIADLADVWGDDAMLSGREVIDRLHRHASHRWDSLSLSRVGEITLAGMLREAGVSSQVRSGQRGYMRSDILGESDIAA